MFASLYHIPLEGFLALTLTQTRALLRAVPTSSQWSDKFGSIKE